MFSKVLTGVLAAGTAAVLVAGPALADPPPGVTPNATDIVGTGSDTIQYLLDQLSVDYNKTVSSSSPHLYSWDATGSTPIQEKSGSTNCSRPRPDGSSAGIAELEANQTDGSSFCVDYARSSRSRASTDPACATGGVCFIYLGGDAVDWAARAAGTNAPKTLTLTQLKNIYLCKTRNWSQVGGKTGTIKPYLPQTASGTRAFFLTALGGGTTPITPGSCVSDGATTAFPDGTIQENEGQDPVLNNVNAIFPYSVADYIAQGYHDAACTSGCGGTVSVNPACTPAGSENLYGCNETTTGAGKAPVLSLMEINGTKPTNTYPLPKEPTPPAVNSTLKVSTKFDTSFQRDVYIVTRFGNPLPNPIPTYLQGVFGPSGFVCKNATGIADVKNYGFLNLATCGTPLNGTG